MQMTFKPLYFGLIIFASVQCMRTVNGYQHLTKKKLI